MTPRLLTRSGKIQPARKQTYLVFLIPRLLALEKYSQILSLNEAIDSFDFGKGVTDTVTVSENFSFALFSNAALNAAPLNQSPFNE